MTESTPKRDCRLPIFKNLSLLPIKGAAKEFFRRERPYVVDPSLVVARPESTYSYPSAHSTPGMVCALVLADLFPEKRAEILAVGRSIGWHRIQLAKHYPTDIYAGRVLAQAIVRNLKSNPGFQQDFAAVKAELAAAAQPAHASGVGE